MKKILLPTDFSDNAWNAIVYALDLYADEACTFFLMNSYTPPLSGASTSITSSSITKTLLDASKKISRKGLEEVLEKITSNYTNELHQFKTISKFDFFLDAVKELVEKETIDLIVMGTKGASGLKEVIMGSNTAGVMGKMDCPVLAIPEKAVFKAPQEIAFATNYDRYYDRNEMAELLHIAGKYNAAIRVLHASTMTDRLSGEQESIKNYIGELLEMLPHSFHNLTGVSLETAVRVFIQSRDITMLCMVGKHHNFFERILGKPRIKEISFHINIPFLVLHETR